MDKHTLTSLITVLLLSTNISPFASAQVTAERILPTQGYLPEQIHFVEIRVQGEPGECLIIETPPVGWAASKISHKGKGENGVIRWAPIVSATAPLALSYRLTPPTDAVGPHGFTGTVNGQPIAGHSTLEPHVTAGTIEHHFIESAILQDAKQVSKKELSVYLPEGYFKSEKRYPVLYLIHGYSGTNRTFLGNGYPNYGKGFLINQIYIDSIADRLIAEGIIPPLIIVLPNVDRQVPLNEVYRKYVVEDVIGYVDRTFRTIPARESRLLAGHSYSGGEALFMAAQYPSVFSLIGIFAPYFDTVPDASILADHDQQKFPLRFYVYVGTNDHETGFIPVNTQKVIDILEEWRIPHTYVEDDSDHWAMIGQRIEDSIIYFSKYITYDSLPSKVENWRLLGD